MILALRSTVMNSQVSGLCKQFLCLLVVCHTHVPYVVIKLVETLRKAALPVKTVALLTVCLHVLSVIRLYDGRSL